MLLSDRRTARRLNGIAWLLLVLGSLASVEPLLYYFGLSDAQTPQGLLGVPLAIGAFFTLRRQNWARIVLVVVLVVIGAMMVLGSIGLCVRGHWLAGLTAFVVAAAIACVLNFLTKLKVVVLFAGSQGQRAT